VTPRAFLAKHGQAVATSIAEAAGTNWPYFKQIAYGHRRPSVELANALVVASVERFQDREQQLDFFSLMNAKKAKSAG
jgi:hypothetical protein